MSEALILDPDGIEGLCCAPYLGKRQGRPAYRCTRPRGHSGCHWTALGAVAERFLVWRDGVTVLRSVLPRMRILGTQTAAAAERWPWIDPLGLLMGDQLPDAPNCRCRMVPLKPGATDP